MLLLAGVIVLTSCKPRLLVTVQFYRLAAAGLTGSRKMGVTVEMKPLAAAGLAWSAHMVSMQLHAIEPLCSDEEDIQVDDSDDEEQVTVLETGIAVGTLFEDADEGL